MACLGAGGGEGVGSGASGAWLGSLACVTMHALHICITHAFCSSPVGSVPLHTQCPPSSHLSLHPKHRTAFVVVECTNPWPFLHNNVVLDSQCFFAHSLTSPETGNSWRRLINQVSLVLPSSKLKKGFKNIIADLGKLNSRPNVLNKTGPSDKRRTILTNVFSGGGCCK